MNSLKSCTSRLILLTLLAAPAWPQSSNGRLRGVIQDQAKAVVPNAAVTALDQATGVEARTVTNDAGLYVFPALVPGTYKITANHPGMAKFEATALVQSQQSTTIDIVLLPSGTQTVVRVEDVTPMVTTHSPDQKHTPDHTRIDNLPLNARSPWNLLTTVPGLPTPSKRTPHLMC